MPTHKQREAFSKITENNGNIGKTMIEVGYDETTAKRPKNLTDSKGWKELMDTYLPDDLLAQKHLELLNQKRLDYFVFPKSMKDDEIEEKVNAAGLEVIVIRDSDKGRMAFYSITDAMSVKSGVDMAYKLKGSYAAEKKDITTAGEKLPSTDLDALATAMADKLKQEKA